MFLAESAASPQSGRVLSMCVTSGHVKMEDVTTKKRKAAQPPTKYRVPSTEYQVAWFQRRTRYSVLGTRYGGTRSAAMQQFQHGVCQESHAGGDPQPGAEIEPASIPGVG